MRILRIIASMDPAKGGPIQMITSTSAIHKELGHQTDVLTLDSPDSVYLKNEGFRSVALGPGNFGWAYSSKLKPWLYQHLGDYDAVILHGLWLYPSVAVTDMINDMERKGQRRPAFLVFPHGMLDPWFQSWKRRPVKTLRNILYWHLIEKKVIQTADLMLFTSQTELRLGQNTFRNYHSRKDITIPYGCGNPPSVTGEMKTAFSQTCPDLGESPYWLYLSRIHPKKGVDLLIESYLKILENPSLERASTPHLVVAGPGMDSAYGSQLLQLTHSAADRIHFPGMLSGDAKWGAFYGSKGFFLPSHQENFGISVAEALGCGTRVYISDQVNIHEEIMKSQAGVVAPDNRNGTFSLFTSAINDLSHAESDMTHGKAIDCFEKHFDIAKTAEILIDLVDEYRISTNKR